jgi:DNA-binding MarR family transcriptional regulator
LDVDMAKPVSNLQDHVGYWLRFVSNNVSQAFAQKVEARGVTVAEWVLMREMFDAGAANPSHLADTLGLTRGTVSKLVERLCRKNLARRSAVGPDRRYHTVALTPPGRKLVPVLARLADENDREFFGHLSAEQRSRLVDQLTNLVQRHGWKDRPVN